MVILSFIAGLALLVLGAELLVRGAARLALALGVPALIIGLTVVAFGTSAPELAVSVNAAWSGDAGVAVGNVVGSNIFNVLFILGASALVAPLLVSSQLVRLDVPVMILVSFLALGVAYDGHIGRFEGAALFLGLCLYTLILIRIARREGRKKEADELGDVDLSVQHSTAYNIACIVGGLAMLVLGSKWLVNGAVAIAQAFGVSELVIGLTIVAAGTSLPEVVTSIVASFKGQRDIAVGNVVGSNIFNILSVLGVSALVAPAPIVVEPAAIQFDFPVMIAVACLCVPIFITGGIISRTEGLVLILYYVAYTTFLVLSALQHDLLPIFSNVMMYLLLPVTVIGFAIATLRAMGRAGRMRAADQR